MEQIEELNYNLVLEYYKNFIKEGLKEDNFEEEYFFNEENYLSLLTSYYTKFRFTEQLIILESQEHRNKFLGHIEKYEEIIQKMKDYKEQRGFFSYTGLDMITKVGMYPIFD